MVKTGVSRQPLGMGGLSEAAAYPIAISRSLFNSRPQKKKAGTASGLPRDAVNRDLIYDVWKRDQVTVTRAPTRARL